MTTIRTRVLSVISKHSRVPVSMITDELNMSQGLGMHPSDTDAMVWHLEDELGIGIVSSDYPGPLSTVAEVVALVERKTSLLPAGT